MPDIVKTNKQKQQKLPCKSSQVNVEEKQIDYYDIVF